MVSTRRLSASLQASNLAWLRGDPFEEGDEDSCEAFIVCQPGGPVGVGVEKEGVHPVEQTPRSQPADPAQLLPRDGHEDDGPEGRAATTPAGQVDDQPPAHLDGSLDGGNERFPLRVNGEFDQDVPDGNYPT